MADGLLALGRDMSSFDELLCRYPIQGIPVQPCVSSPRVLCQLVSGMQRQLALPCLLAGCEFPQQVCHYPYCAEFSHTACIWLIGNGDRLSVAHGLVSTVILKSSYNLSSLSLEWGLGRGCHRDEEVLVCDAEHSESKH